MKKNYILLVAVIAVLSFGYDADAANLLSNGGFETGDLSSWGQYTYPGGAGLLATTTAARTDTYGLWIYTADSNLDSPSISLAYQDVNASQEDFFTGSAYIRTPNGAGWVADSYACIRVLFLSSLYNVIATYESAHLTTANTAYGDPYTVTTLPAPAGTAHARLELYLYEPQGSSSVSIANFDDCNLEKEIVTIISPPDGSVVSAGIIPVVGTIRDLSITTIDLNGNEVKCYENTWETNLAVTPGENVITVTAVDAGNNVYTDTATITYDPNASTELFDIIYPANGAVFHETPALVTATLSDPSSLYININGVEYLAKDGALIARVPIAAGSNTLELRCRDQAGHEKIRYLNITFDTNGIGFGGVIANNSFENSAYPQKNWGRWSGNQSFLWVDGSTSFISNTVAHSGSQSSGQVLYGSADRWGGLKQEFSVTPGDTINASGYVNSLTSDDPLTPEAEAYIEIKYISNRGNEIEKYTSTKITGATDAWVQLSVSSTVPDGAETAIFGFIQIGDNSSTGKVYFDDAYVEVVPGNYTPPAKNPITKPQSTGPVRISGRTLLLNGDPFKIKGVAYQPIPIGYQPGYDIYNTPAIYNRDLPLLRAMNVNTIRTYGVVTSKAFLDACYNGGVDPIYVVMGFYVDTESDLSHPDVRDGIKDDFRAYVSTYKDHPAVLMWSPGNETELVYEGRDRDVFTLLNELAEVAYVEEGSAYHPVTAVIENIEEIDDNGLFTTDDDMDYIDVWGGNVYEGITFDDMFDDVVHRTKKPFWVSEYGIDAYHVNSYHFDGERHVVDTGGVNENEQADWIAALTAEIMLSDVPIGGMVFEYTDEWWKEGAPSVHDNSGSARDPRVDEWVFPDRFQNEEYWGIFEADGITERQVYYVLKGLFEAEDAWILNMTEMDWYENTDPYDSTGAATCQMILNYIREGAGEPALTQDEIYEYARYPLPYDGTELTADEVDRALGHFDPYDYLVSNWADGYDSLPGGNPYQGYNYTVDTYDPLQPDAMNEYMRDICHWMAYTVTKGNWWDPLGELVARPNTPAAVPIYGTYDHWVAVKGCVTSENPVPNPRVNPWGGPDFTVYGFWMKDPQVTGIGQNTYKTAAECESTYFLPLVAIGDPYNGLLLQIAEPPAQLPNDRLEITGNAKIKKGSARIKEHTRDLANLEFVGVKLTKKDHKNVNGTMASLGSTSPIIKQSWRDLVDPYLLTDSEAVAAFKDTQMGASILVDRIDIGGSDYYLVPFGKFIEGKFLASAVIMLDANNGYFREASWTKEPEKFLKVDKTRAIDLVMKRQAYATADSSYIQTREAELIWKPNGYSSSPYKPYWKVYINGRIWYVTQEEKVIPGGLILKRAIEMY